MTESITRGHCPGLVSGLLVECGLKYFVGDVSPNPELMVWVRTQGPVGARVEI